MLSWLRSKAEFDNHLHHHGNVEQWFRPIIYSVWRPSAFWTESVLKEFSYTLRMRFRSFFAHVFAHPFFWLILPHFFIDFDSTFEWFGFIFGTWGLSKERLKRPWPLFARMSCTRLWHFFFHIFEPGPPSEWGDRRQSDYPSGSMVKPHLGHWNVAKPWGNHVSATLPFPRPLGEGN